MSNEQSQTGATSGVVTRNQAAFIGVGGMVGAGIFALLGEAGAIAASAVWLSFLCAGAIAMLQGYSFAALGKRYASEAGLMGYLAAGFGEDTRVTGVSSWMVWASQLIVIAMVAVSFGTYAAGLLSGGAAPGLLVKVMATVIVVAAVLLNGLGGAGVVAKTQTVLLVLVITVLTGIAIVTMATADWSRLAPSTYPPVSSIIGSIALTFFAFLGFGVVSFTAKDLKNKDDLAPATYLALVITTVLYVIVSLGVFGQLTPEQVTAAGPTAIALAVEPVLGTVGYVIVAIVALLSTAGAVTSTFYPAPRLLGYLAARGVFPPLFGKKWGRFDASLLISGVLSAVLVWLFDLTVIASLGSAVALVVFLVISVGHYRIREVTGASGAVLLIGMLTIVITLAGFVRTTLETSPASLVAFVVLAALAYLLDASWRARHRTHGGAVTTR